MVFDNTLCEPSDTAFSEAVGIVCWFLDAAVSVLQTAGPVAVV